MDFFFEEQPSTTQSSSKGHGDSLVTENTDYDPSGDKSYSVALTEIQEQQGSSSVDDISRRAQEMVEKINQSRASDQNVMDSFEQKLIQKVTEMFQQMKEHMYTVYEKNSAEMQLKLQELAEVLDSCTKLNDELVEAGQALASLREALGITQSSNQ
ncbi:synaptonemal complex central element protein 2 [Austrofundulus limnaeus]|uniref:Synaptonemal complex central element protein 2 n=1 Tax=Austrofundulus limnaeus TaxID=52670 RepID=A0A2I4C0I4_AUSLI|nr:PREDICTED: synaptonemal complex central element protein 2-like [Austrofundulus limnaeus]